MLYPLRFEPVLKERIWGGTGLRDELGRELPDGKIGESWEITCREDGDSRVAAGPLQGKYLSELVDEFGPELLGEKIAGTARYGFPLLLKILDAQDVLSVQVHPDDEFAAAHEGCAGKNEVWYILKARPGARIIYGLRPGVTKEEFIAALNRGQLEKCLNEVAVKAGEIYPIPPGLVHALGEGIMVVELQQNSDLTYRVFDWNRLDGQGQARPLHVEKALQVIDFGKAPPRGFSPEEVDDGFSLENEDFTLLYRRVTGENNMSQSPEAFTILTVVGGEGELRHQGRVYPLRYGDSYLLPACLGRYTLCGELKLLFGSANRPLNIP
ncbi:MAG: class I mannose-6-phosphate isomerase [Firmicutes bacterium]|nr:class I mannose-6-phosphate isomerase [Bacillota bacterium]